MASPSQPIPLTYRLMFNYFEPFMATLGALQALIDPETLTQYTLPSIFSLKHVAAPTDIIAALAPLHTQSAGAWLMLAFHDAVTLRVFAADVRVWRLVLGAALLSDVGYTAGLVQSMGVVGFCDPREWDAARAFTVITTVIPMMMKVTFLLGIGLGRSSTSASRKKQ